MKPLRVLTYIIACLLLGALYFASARNDAAAPSTIPPPVVPFLDVRAVDLSQVTLSSGDTSITFSRDAERWKIEPPAPPTSADLIPGILDGLIGAPPIERISDVLQRLGDFGLAPPLGRITLRRPGKPDVTVDIGGGNPAGTAVYARLNSGPEVALIGLQVQYYFQLAIDAARR